MLYYLLIVLLLLHVTLTYLSHDIDCINKYKETVVFIKFLNKKN